jgi:hypothetical protein
MQICIKHRISLWHAEMTRPWPPGSDPQEAQGTLMTLLPWDTVQGLSEIPDLESGWDSCCEQREEKQITEDHLHESSRGRVELKRPSVTIHKHVQFSLWTILQVSQVHRQELIVSCTFKLCGDLLSQLQQCVGLAEYTAAAVSSCGKHQHSEWGPCVGHTRPRSQHSGMPIARSRRSPNIHHPKGHQGALTYQSEKDSEERVQRVE